MRPWRRSTVDSEQGAVRAISEHQQPGQGASTLQKSGSPVEAMRHWERHLGGDGCGGRGGLQWQITAAHFTVNMAEFF